MQRDPYQELHRMLAQAEAIVIGAGAGLSASAGLTYSGKRFTENFSDFIDKYHFSDLYSGSFFPFPSLEEKWAYWSRMIWLNRYQAPPKPVYGELLALVRDRDVFVLTTNVDHCFQRAGLEKERLFYTQGDYGLWQCSQPCHDRTYDNRDAVRRMVAEQSEMAIPSEQIPTCPICGRPMTMNLRMDHTFVQAEGWYRARARYTDFLRRHQGMRLLFLELGVGENTPGIIKYPFWKMVFENPKAAYASICLDAACAPKEIADRSICIQADIGQALAILKEKQIQSSEKGRTPI